MRRVTSLAVAMSVFLAAAPAWAARTKAHEMAESPQYGRKFFGMLGRGALNVVTCFVDPIVHTVRETKVGPPFVGTLTGLGSGVGCGVLRLGSGALDIVTSWVPGFNGFPVSDSYDNCITQSASASLEHEPLPAGYRQPATTWEVPTTEPGAAQAPAPIEKPKRQWTK